MGGANPLRASPRLYFPPKEGSPRSPVRELRLAAIPKGASPECIGIQTRASPECIARVSLGNKRLPLYDFRFFRTFLEELGSRY